MVVDNSGNTEHYRPSLHVASTCLTEQEVTHLCLLFTVYCLHSTGAIVQAIYTVVYAYSIEYRI